MKKSARNSDARGELDPEQFLKPEPKTKKQVINSPTRNSDARGKRTSEKKRTNSGMKEDWKQSKFARELTEKLDSLTGPEKRSPKKTSPKKGLRSPSRSRIVQPTVKKTF